MKLNAVVISGVFAIVAPLTAYAQTAESERRLSPRAREELRDDVRSVAGDQHLRPTRAQASRQLRPREVDNAYEQRALAQTLPPSSPHPHPLAMTGPSMPTQPSYANAAVGAPGGAGFLIPQARPGRAMPPPISR